MRSGGGGEPPRPPPPPGVKPGSKGEPGVPRPEPQPLMTWPSPITVVNGWLRDHEESKTFPVRQITPVYWTARSWPLLTTAPVPLMRVLTWRALGAVAFAGMVIVGPA